MGSYSVLKVGRVILAWKYRIPTFATFLFERSDYYERPRGDPMAPDYDHMGTTGYRSTADAVRQRLNELGFTLPFWGSVADEILAEIDDYQVELVGEALAARERDEFTPFDEFKARARAYLSCPPARSHADDIAGFITLLRDALNAESPPSWAERIKGRFERDGDELHVDPSGLSFELGQNPLDIDPGVLRISAMLDESRVEDFPEVVDLFLVRCLVEAVEPEAEVHLDLSDVWDEGEDFSNQPAELANALLHKLQVYTRVFSVLSENEPDVRQRAARGEARVLMQQLQTAATADAKGRALEHLMALIFGSHPDLLISERRLNLGDQEIDLVVDNHVDHTFWKKLGSPFFLVECKNWSSRVGTDEIRDFETKIRDHQPHARLGILVAVSGFSREAKTALARASREPYQLVLVTGEDLEGLIDTGFDVLPWLERLIARFG